MFISVGESCLEFFFQFYFDTSEVTAGMSGSSTFQAGILVGEERETKRMFKQGVGKLYGKGQVRP